MNLSSLKKRKLFVEARNLGQLFASRFVLLQKAKKARGLAVQQGFVVGITVSKKVSKKAVHRNKVKRRLRNILYNKDILALLDERYYYVIIAKANIIEATYKNIYDNLFSVLQKAKIAADPDNE